MATPSGYQGGTAEKGSPLATNCLVPLGAYL